MTTVTVIVPVFNEPQGLLLCLEALKRQDTFASYEVIVVDNGSTVELPDVRGIDPRFRIIREHVPGSYAARNRGIQEARGEILAFTDSDCIPVPNWIDSAVQVFESEPTVSLIAGHIEVTYAAPSKPTPSEIYERIFSFRQDRSVTQGWAVTANLFVRRGVFEEIGKFDSTTFSGADADFTRRATRAGYAMRYSPGAAVSHPARSTLEQLKRLRRRHVGGFYKLSATRPEYHQMFSLIGIVKDFIYPIKGAAAIFGEVVSSKISLVDGVRAFLVLSYVWPYRGMLKIGYRCGWLQEFERC